MENMTTIFTSFTRWARAGLSFFFSPGMRVSTIASLVVFGLHWLSIGFLGLGVVYATSPVLNLIFPDYPVNTTLSGDNTWPMLIMAGIWLSLGILLAGLLNVLLLKKELPMQIRLPAYLVFLVGFVIVTLSVHYHSGFVLAAKEKAFFKAIKSGSVKEVSAMLKKGAVLNPASPGAITARIPLMYAVEAGRIDMVQMLVKRGAKVNVTNYVGDTALDRAVRKQHLKMVLFLLRKGATLPKNAFKQKAYRKFLKAETSPEAKKLLQRLAK
jgi:hypothetical protein